MDMVEFVKNLPEYISHPLLCVPLALAIINHLSGIFKAAVHKKVNPKLLLKGAIKVFIYITIGVILFLMAAVSPELIPLFSPLSMLVSFTEAASIVENLFVVAKKLDLDIPVLEKLIEIFRLNKEKLLGEINPLNKDEVG